MTRTNAVEPKFFWYWSLMTEPSFQVVSAFVGEIPEPGTWLPWLGAR